MAVNLTVSKTLDGTAVSDSLDGSGTGVDYGSVTNGSYAPVTDKVANTGKLDLYIRHDATIDPITNFRVSIQQYGIGTGFTYGGADSAANDFTTLTTLGQNSGSSKNNSDGLSGGIWCEMDADATDVTQFDFATNGGGNGIDTVKIFGDNGTDGIDDASAFTIKADSMVYDAPGETLASAPVDGQLGKANDTALGDNSKQSYRIFITTAFASGGIIQWEQVYGYSFTA